jgi:hypothetical protein
MARASRPDRNGAVVVDHQEHRLVLDAISRAAENPDSADGGRSSPAPPLPATVISPTNATVPQLTATAATGSFPDCRA